MTASSPPLAAATRTGLARGTGIVDKGVVPGALAGACGGQVFGAAMLSLHALGPAAAIVRSDSQAVGLAVHMVIATILGAGFGALVAHHRVRSSELLFWGLAYGAFWWFLGTQTLLPLLTGRPVAWDLDGARALLPALVGHLYYGAATAVAFVLIRRSPEAGPRLRGRTVLRGFLAGTAAAAVLYLAFDRGAGAAAGWLPAAGAAMGLGYPVLFTGRREATGPALIRGTVYGFLAWVALGLTLPPLVGEGALDWSQRAAASAVADLPPFLLLGAGTAVLFTWLGGMARGLFLDDVRLIGWEAVPGTRGIRATVHGVLAGLAGGVMFTVVMAAVGTLPTVARLVGAQAAVVGLGVHLVIAQLIGVSYAVLFRRRTFDLASGIGWGVSYGFLWWHLGWLTLLPVLLGDEPRWNAAAMAAAFPALAGHLAYGAALGAAHHLLEARANPWWAVRGRVEAERTAARLDQMLGSAPALWILTTTIALAIPLLVSG